MTNPISVSVIVPIHNSEDYLPSTLDSLRAQTATEMEVILVDDGSLDASADICRKYTEIDSRFRLIQSEWGGVGKARNLGIEAASGRFLAFLDSDDSVEPTMYATMSEYGDSLGADCVSCEFVTVYRDRPARRSWTKHPKDVLLGRDYIEDRVIPSMIGISFDEGYATLGIWTKLYRRSLVEQHRLRFAEDRTKEEDQRFIIDFLSKAQSIVFLPQHLHRYQKRSDSLISTYSDRFSNVHSNLRHYEELFGDRYNFKAGNKLRFNVSIVEECVLYTFTHPASAPAPRTKVIAILTEPDVSAWYTGLESPTFFQECVKRSLSIGRYHVAYFLFQLRYSPARLKAAIRRRIPTLRPTFLRSLLPPRYRDIQ